MKASWQRIFCDNARDGFWVSHISLENFFGVGGKEIKI
jgi:hypothetical protein